MFSNRSAWIEQWKGNQSEIRSLHQSGSSRDRKEVSKEETISKT